MNQPSRGRRWAAAVGQGISWLAVLAVAGVLLSPVLAPDSWAVGQLELNGCRLQTQGRDTQVVLDWNGSPRSVRIEPTASGALKVSFSGRLKPGMTLPRTAGEPSGLVCGVQAKTQGNRSELLVHPCRSVTARWYPLAQPDRLVVQLSPEAGPAPAMPQPAQDRVQTVAPGVEHRQLARQTAQGPVLVNVLVVDPSRVDVFPVLARGTLTGRARLTEMAQAHSAVAGVNASFFNKNVGVPLGTLLINEEVLSGPLFERVCLGLTAEGRPRMARLALQGWLQLPDAQRIRLDGVNQPRVASHQLVLYSPRWGGTAPPVPGGGVQIQLRQGRVSAVSTGHPLAIPADGVVLSGPQDDRTRQLAAWLPPAEAPPPAHAPISLKLSTVPDWSDVRHAVSGGPYLVREGRVYVDAAAQRIQFGRGEQLAPRTAVGILPSGKLMLVTVDGRQKEVSVGLSLHALAELMRSLGAVEAMNLDGGSSTQMVVAGHVVNSPSVPGGLAVSTGLMVRPKKPSALSQQPSSRPGT